MQKPTGIKLMNFAARNSLPIRLLAVVYLRLKAVKEGGELSYGGVELV